MELRVELYDGAAEPVRKWTAQVPDKAAELFETRLRSTCERRADITVLQAEGTGTHVTVRTNPSRVNYVTEQIEAALHMAKHFGDFRKKLDKMTSSGNVRA